MADNLELEVKEMLSKLTGLEVDEIKETDDIINDLGIDSLKVIEIATSIEKNYKIVVKDSELAKLRTVKDAVTFIRGLLKKKNA